MGQMNCRKSTFQHVKNLNGDGEVVVALKGHG